MIYDMKWNNMEWPEIKCDGAVLYATTHQPHKSDNCISLKGWMAMYAVP